ncbi:MAG: hypothetical protein IPO94_18830 [Saprospiraceae bacterium]|nr:hypothetical protein [Saprospiraceae bacterium]
MIAVTAPLISPMASKPAITRSFDGKVVVVSISEAVRNDKYENDFPFLYRSF